MLFAPEGDSSKKSDARYSKSGPGCVRAKRSRYPAPSLYLDLADPKWRVVRITRKKWQIIKNAPVKFVRPRGMLRTPDPKRGGCLDDLKPFINVANDSDFALVKAFLVSLLRPNLPFPVLVLTGEHGSAKSSMAQKSKSLVDPSKAATRGAPRELRDLAIAASNGWVLAFDNMSHIPEWLSDALCRLSTGSGFSTRELYSDSDEKIFESKRPVILNGISDMVTRSDLLDRSIIIQLPIIDEGKRKQEADLNKEFERLRPGILGALLDVAVHAVAKHPTTKLTSLPRMADFATWAVAAEPAHHRGEAIFLKAYTGNRAAWDSVAIDASVVGPPILQLMERAACWEGVFGDLLDALNAIVSQQFQKSREWPKSARAISGELRRIAPNLRAIGIQVTIGKHTENGTPLKLERVCKTPSASSASQTNKDLDPDDPSTTSSADRPQPSGIVSRNGSNSLNSHGSDDPDDTDGVCATSSCEDEERL